MVVEDVLDGSELAVGSVKIVAGRIHDRQDASHLGVKARNSAFQGLDSSVVGTSLSVQVVDLVSDVTSVIVGLPGVVVENAASLNLEL